ncbi:MAG TPA: hypothetical protein VE261_02375, partial [Gaiellaceae bacterium]|nr:hypothetical protein [Gaiellaceae bacterium]
MTNALIATSAGLFALSILLATLYAGRSRRSRREVEARVGEAVEALERRMDDLAAELAGAVERAEEETRRSRVLADLSSSIDLDEVLARTLDAAGALPGVDAAVVRLPNVDGLPLVASLGIAQEEAERQAVSGPPDGSPVRSIELSYRYPEGATEAVVRAGLAVPLADEHG